MTDSQALVERLRLLSPDAACLDRMRADVERSVEAAQTSLLAEWLGLVRARPLRHSAYALGAVALLFLVTPLAALPLALLRQL